MLHFNYLFHRYWDWITIKIDDKHIYQYSVCKSCGHVRYRTLHFVVWFENLHKLINKKWFKQKDNDIIIKTFKELGYKIHKNSKGFYEVEKEGVVINESHVEIVRSMKYQGTFNDNDIRNTILELFGNKENG